MNRRVGGVKRDIAEKALIKSRYMSNFASFFLAYNPLI